MPRTSQSLPGPYKVHNAPIGSMTHSKFIHQSSKCSGSAFHSHTPPELTPSMHRTEVHINISSTLSSIIPAADRASRDSKQHADTSTFILTGRGRPLVHRRYIYLRLKVRGHARGGGGAATAPTSDIVSHSSCPVQSGMLSAERNSKRLVGSVKF